MTSQLPALSLWQPWASLCVIQRPCEVCGGVGHLGPATHSAQARYGEVCAACPGPWKGIETRGWRAPSWLIGQRFAIAASVSFQGFADLPGDCEGKWEAGWQYGYIGPFQVGVCRRSSSEGRRGDTFIVYAPGDYEPRIPGYTFEGTLPLGAVVGTAVLADCLPMIAASDSTDYDHDVLVVNDIDDELYIDHPFDPLRMEHPRRTDVVAERPFGHFGPGRWAWLLSEVERFDEPIPARGRQGIWTWELTDG